MEAELTPKAGRPWVGTGTSSCVQRRTAVGLALLVAVSMTSAEALTVEVKKGPIDGRETTIISVKGEIKPGDDEKFTGMADGKGDAVVILDSPGGNVLAGIQIGEAIRRNGYSTLVPRGLQCASACALAWLGGRTRLMAPRRDGRLPRRLHGGRPQACSRLGRQRRRRRLPQPARPDHSGDRLHHRGAARRDPMADVRRRQARRHRGEAIRRRGA